MTDLTWDTQGRLSSYSENGETFTYGFEYGGVAAQTSKTDAGGNRWIFTVDSDGLITQRQPPSVAGAAPSYATYNSDGTIQLATDETGVKTYYTYAGQGRVASVTKDYQGSTSVRFDYAYDTNFPEKVISILPKNSSTNANDPNWQGWTYDYYQAGDPAPGALHHVYRLRNDGVTADLMATYAYDAHGRVTSTTDAAGSVTDYMYGASGNLPTVTAPSNNDAGVRPVTTYGYDVVGRVTSVTDPLGKSTTYAYDALDRVTSVTLPKPSAGSPLNFTTTYTYDTFESSSSLTFTDVTDPNGRVTRQGYDQFGRLRRSVDTLGNATSYAYTRDLLASITDANGYTTSYEYDALKRLSATVFPDNARESYAYRADGLLQSKTDRKSQAISYGYDAMKRLRQKTYPNGATIQYTYQGQMLTQVVDSLNSPSETHTFGYDPQLRMTSNTQGPRGTLTYTYGANDAVGTMTVSGGPTTTYAYYPDGSLNTIQWTPVAGLFKYAYRLNGQYDTITMPNGQTRSYAYDDQGRLTQLTNTHPTAGTLAAYGYGYDVNNLAGGAMTMLGQRTSMTATVPSQNFNAAVTRYGYDNAYQLTQAEYPSGPIFNGEVHNWTYDAIGNRLTSAVNGAVNGAVTNYTYQKLDTNPNNWQRLTSAGATSFAYDPNGNTQTMGSNTFGYDYENRQTSVSGGAAATYRYDYQGRRTSKTTPAMTSYLYDGLNLSRDSGSASSDYLFGPGIDEPLAMSSATGVSYTAVDALGSVNQVNDALGISQNVYVHDVWGVRRAVSETLPQPFRYTGRETAEVSGQLFYRARYYQTDLGRFVAEDPARARTPDLDRNGYAYAANAPVFYGDPLGLFTVQGCCDVPPFDGVSKGLADACWRMRRNSKCQAILKQTNVFGQNLAQCMEKNCAFGSGIPINCSAKNKEDCGESFYFGGGSIVLYPGNKNCPKGKGQGYGPTIFHESLHHCGFGPENEPYKNGPYSKLFATIMQICTGSSN
jgi:RHS repeat-associated protein